MWLPIVIISQFANAIALFLDKFLLTKKFPRPAVITFWTSVGNLLALVFVFWDFEMFPGWKIMILSLIAGAVFTIGLQFLYLGIKEGEVSHITPLTGAVVPVVTFIISYFWLGEMLAMGQLIGVLFLVFGALLISFEKSVRHNGLHIGMLWAVIAGVFFAVSFTLLRGVFMEVSFSTGFVWSRIGAFAAALPLLLLPGMLKDVFGGGTKKKRKDTSSGLLILAINKFFAAIYFIGMNYAIALVSATLVNALAGLQYAILFLIIFVSTKLFPRFMKEKFTRGEIVQQVLAIVLIMIGLGLIIIV